MCVLEAHCLSLPPSTLFASTNKLIQIPQCEKVLGFGDYLNEMGSKGNRMCKGPEGRLCLECLNSNKKTNEAGVE